MRHTFRFDTRGVARVDLHLMLSIVMLTVFGLVMILSAILGMGVVVLKKKAF